MSVNWFSEESHLLLNPRTPKELQEKIKINDFPGHIFIATSGTTSLGDQEMKLVALSKQAILASAQAVNAWVGASSSDVWLNPLPLFHIGGLAILARAELAGSSVHSFEGKWQAKDFCQRLQEIGATLTSLVPTQLFDLVQAKLFAPKKLRAVFIGGAALSEKLYSQARELGWPLLPTFGCSEAASQIATASLGSLEQGSFPRMEVLPHVEYRVDKEQRLSLKGPSLFSGYFLFKNGVLEFADPKEGGWFLSPDRVEIEQGKLRSLGRGSEFVKINGEGVEVSRLREKLSSLVDIGQEVEILAVSDERKGARLILVGTVDKEALQKLADQYNSEVYPFERVTEVFSVTEIPRSELGKVLQAVLVRELGFCNDF